MTDHNFVKLDENDILIGTYIDSARGVLHIDQCSTVAPQTIEKFKNAGWVVEEGVRMGRDGKPVPREPPTFPVRPSNQKVKNDE